MSGSNYGVQYRKSKIGEALFDALDSFVSEGKLTGEQADAIQEQFDKAAAKYLGSSQVRAQLKGDLHTYRSFDEIYTLLVKDCEIKLSTTKREPKSAGQVNPQQSTETLKADMVKLICQDAKIGGPRADALLDRVKGAKKDETYYNLLSKFPCHLLPRLGEMERPQLASAPTFQHAKSFVAALCLEETKLLRHKAKGKGVADDSAWTRVKKQLQNYVLSIYNDVRFIHSF